eukprot:jgi/Ulvmu1/9818/UM056_0059.1
MPVSIAGKLVLITGASSGIGAACAEAFAAQSCHLILLARREQRLLDMKTRLESEYNVKVVTLVKDMSDISAVKNVLEELPEDCRDIDILVNNAGLALGVAAGHEADTQECQHMVNVNVLGVMAMTQLIVPGMVKRGSGHVFMMSSIAGHEAYGGGAIYCATKHAVQAFTDSLRHDLNATPIRVTAISPGAVKTEFSVVRYAGDEAKADAVYAGIEPLTGPDIADDVIFAATRPAHVQVANIVTLATHQSGAKNLARVLESK